MKKTIGLLSVMLIAMMAVTLISCKKEAEKPAPVTPAAPPVVAPDKAPDGPAPVAPEVAAPTEPAAPAAPAEPVAAAPAPAAVPAGMVALDLQLPNATFRGTPTNLNVPNMEKPLGRPRDPFLAPEGVKLISKGKPVISEDPIFGELELITDGDKEAADGCYVVLGPMKQEIVVDLEAEYEIYAIVVWHFHQQPAVYFDVIAQIGEDQDFIKSAIVFNNDIDNSSGMGVGTDMHYVETNEGKLIDAKGTRGRFVKMVSNGNNANDLNHYIEVEVWGKPVQ